jgi:outer membrane protein OmpA-like peptidoglycan-associated protein
MHTKSSLLIALLCALLAPALASAQQTSKSKSKERFREKDLPGNKVTVTNATGLNSKNTDYSPAFYDNGIVYVSSRKKTGAQDRKTGETFSELYFAPFDPNLMPASPHKFSLDINSQLHEGPVTFSRDLKTMFYTQNNQRDGVPKAGRDGVVRLKIYEAKRGPIDWVPRGELPFNSDEYSCLHPSLSADGKMLYFSSDMPGGAGGFDLYVSERQPDGTWGTPRNLGPTVNTDKSEVFPFVHPNGTLFFSSNGHANNLGGLDIFFVDRNDDGSESVVNMDTPYNSPEDDLGFIIDDELKRGFFTSNRKGDARGAGGSIGKDDIFAFTIEKGIEGVRPTTRPGRIVVTDVRTGKPVQGAELRILKASREGFVDNDSTIYDLDLQPIDGDASRVSLQLRPKSSERMRRADLLTNAVGEARADFLRYRSYVVMVNAPGYLLSQQYITSEDETDEAVVRVQLGTAPLCHRARGTVATDQLGTRVANATLRFVHKASGKTETTRTNLNGDYDVCLPLDGDYLVQIERKGFLPANYELAASLTQTDFHETRLRPTQIGGDADAEQPLAGAVQDGSVIVLDRITYEPNKATLNHTAIRDLDALYGLLQRYSDMEIELVCHTATDGNAAQNQALSEERAQNAQAYLVYRGIAEKRIKAVGKGSTEPRNRCQPGVPCSPEEHLANQRLEVKVKRGKA